MRIKIASQVPVVQAVVSGTFHIATKDGEAMFLHDTIDFSQYAGWDGGYTPYLLSFTDAAGKVATAYGASKGGGASLGTDVFGGYDLTNWTAGTSATILNATQFNAAAAGAAVRKEVFTAGSLYSITAATDNAASRFYNATGFATEAIGNSNSITNFLFTTYGALPTFFGIRAGAIAIIAVTAAEAYKYTDIPATGLHLVSAKNGTTRNLTSKESGFNPNTVVSVSIQRQRVSFLNVRP